MRYSTIAAPAEAEIEVKRSRFICRVQRIEDEPSARAVIEAARKEFWDARHHCSAFVIGPDAALRRSNDDGEPAGTAGAPILEVISRRGLSDVVAVVIRYFGGTLLGAGGLVRAYGDTCGAALDVAGLVSRELRQIVEVDIDHASAGRLENDLRSRFHVLGVEYGQAVTVSVSVPEEQTHALEAEVASLSAGTAVVRKTRTAWVDIP